MEAEFNAWLGNAEEFNRFETVQYSRGLFPLDMPDELLYAFCQSLPERIKKWQTELGEENIRYFLSDYGNERFYSEEIELGEGWETFVIFTAGRLTLLSTSCDGEHQARMRSVMADREWALRYGDEVTGFRQKPVLEFLKLLHFYMIRHKRTCSAKTFRSIFQHNMDYLLDDVQMEAVESSDDADAANIFLSGGAGSGKSVTGFQWLVMHPVKEAKKICLSFSDTQRHMLEYWQESENRIRRSMNIEELPDIECSIWFDFLSEHARPFIERGRYALNTEQSFAAFYEICRLLPTVYWKDIPGEAVKDKMFYLWGEIHGLIKGAMFTRNFDEGSWEPLTRKQYGELRSFHKGSAENNSLTGQGITMLFQLYERYEEYLKSRHFIDDNDIARIVINHIAEIKQNKDFVKYHLAFLDDCQDLTEIQMYAAFSLLSDCTQKFMAFDRCQILQPTWFHPGFVQKTAEQLFPKGDDVYSLRYHLPNQYRSLLEVMRFQGSILDELGVQRNLSDLDLRPAKFAEQDLREGLLPIWIADTGENREILHNLLEETEAGDIFVLHSTQLSMEERDGKHFSLSEYKGIGISSAVMLWNLFSEAESYMNEAQAWEYFYVGALRPETCLFVLETEKGTIGAFLEQLAVRGIIEKCESLNASYADGRTWLEELRQRIDCSAEESELEEAYHLYLHEEYQEALSIYGQYQEKREAVFHSMICEGKLAEANGDFSTALELYFKMADESVVGVYCIREFLDNTRIPPELRFAANLYFLNDMKYAEFNGPSGLKSLFEDYHDHRGHFKLGVLIDKVVSMYPGLGKNLDGWTKAVWKEMDSFALAIDDIIDREADWRVHHE